jgi:hypothetical protein
VDKGFDINQAQPVQTGNPRIGISDASADDSADVTPIIYYKHFLP